jgi:hypothetical protein
MTSIYGIWESGYTGTVDGHLATGSDNSIGYLPDYIATAVRAKNITLFVMTALEFQHDRGPIYLYPQYADYRSTGTKFITSNCLVIYQVLLTFKSKID